jgi:hypothetical protein
MLKKPYVTASIIVFGVLLASAPISAFAAKMAPNMKMLDPDGDGTVSLDEAQKAGAVKFDVVDPDKDGTLNKKEAKHLMSKKVFKMANPDKDGSIDKTEYAATVEAAFKKADPDGDGSLDRKELSSSAGKKLLMLVQ